MISVRTACSCASPFAAITITVTDTAGATRSQRNAAGTARHLVANPMMVLALPQIPASPRLVAARIDKPWNKTMASEARLYSAPEGTGWSIGTIVTMAAIGGMLIVPLLLNFGFYAVLRRQFVLWRSR